MACCCAGSVSVAGWRTGAVVTVGCREFWRSVDEVGHALNGM